MSAAERNLGETSGTDDLLEREQPMGAPMRPKKQVT